MNVRKKKRNYRKSSRIKIIYSKALLSVIFLAVPFFFWIITSTQLKYCKKSIKDLDNSITVYDQRIVRESAQWQALRKPESVNQAVRRHGMQMDFPSTSQIVVVHENGREQPSPHILAQVRQFVRNENMVDIGGR